MTYESVSKTQADLEKVSKSTIERKSMSTKTSIKRIALVAVAALGFGMVNGNSAFAAAGDITFALTADVTSTTAQAVGTAVSIPVNVSTSSITSDASGATCSFTATITTKPTNSALTTQSTSASVASSTVVSGVATSTATAAVAATSGAKITVTQVHATTTTSSKVAGAFSFTPDVAGYYIVTLTAAGTNATGGGTTTCGTTDTVGVNVGGAALIQAQSGLGATSGTQVAGRQFAFAFHAPYGSTSSTTYKIEATNASIGAVYVGASKADAANAASYTGSTGVTKVNGTDYSNGAYYQGVRTTTNLTSITVGSGTANTDSIIVQASGASAGTATITVKSIDNTTGVLTTKATITVTLVASGSTAISAANSTIGIQSAACPTVGTSKTSDENALANAAPQSFGSAAGGLLHVCIYTRDANGNLISAQTSSSIITSLGYIGTTSTPSTGATNPSSAASSLDFYLLGVSTMKGSATVTATLIDAAGYAVTLTTPVTWYGTLATLELAPNPWSAQPYADAYATSAPAVSALALTAKDSNGNQIDLATAANSVTSATFTVDSSGTTGAPADRTSDSLGGAVATNFSSTDLTTYGVGNFVSVSCANSTGAEKLTITAWGKDSLNNWVKSNSVDYYCSSSTVASLTVTPASAEVARAKTTTLDVVAKDANGFMVPDGTAVSWATTSGTVIANSTSTLNGSLKYDATYTAADADGKVIVTAVAGTKGFSAITELTVGTGSSDASSAVDAANEATDAANAATDAANAAAEAADAATAAAQDAQAAVAALATQVADLISGIKAQITALTNLVVKIQKKVKA